MLFHQKSARVGTFGCSIIIYSESLSYLHSNVWYNAWDNLCSFRMVKQGPMGLAPKLSIDSSLHC